MPSEVRFAEIERLLRNHGWTSKRSKGSHFCFTGPDRPLVVVPVHRGRVKPVYVREVYAAIERVTDRPRDG